MQIKCCSFIECSRAFNLIESIARRLLSPYKLHCLVWFLTLAGPNLNSPAKCKFIQFLCQTKATTTWMNVARNKFLRLVWYLVLPAGPVHPPIRTISSYTLKVNLIRVFKTYSTLAQMCLKSWFDGLILPIIFFRFLSYLQDTFIA